MATPSILITGATGFVGRHLCNYLKQHNVNFRAVIRQGRPAITEAVETSYINCIDKRTDWNQALQGIECVIHLASLGDLPTIDEEQHRTVNYQGTLRLAQQAIQHKVKKIIFLSTIKVNGEISGTHPFTADDIPLPVTAYARSKASAEEALLEIDANNDLSVMIIRPPMVYGAGGRNNINLLAKAIKYHIPLPFASIDNRRSMVNVINLCSFIYRMTTLPANNIKVALISDGVDVSTAELIHKIAHTLHCRPHLFKCHPSFIKTALKLIKRNDWYAKLCCNLQVDTADHYRQFQWQPEVSIDQALESCFE